MDLASLDTTEIANKGRAVNLLHPATQVPIGKRFYVLGFDSDIAKKILRDQEIVRQEKQKKSRNGRYIATPEEVEANGLDLLVGLTTGWDEDVLDAEGNVVGTRPEIELTKGEFIPFSPEAARKIYQKRGTSWIREQIDFEIGDRRDFLPKEK